MLEIAPCNYEVYLRTSCSDTSFLRPIFGTPPIIGRSFWSVMKGAWGEGSSQKARHEIGCSAKSKT